MTTLSQPETQRLFIAVELPPEAVSALSKLIHGLRASNLQGMSLVAAKNIHLTLKFLGNVDEAQVPSLTAALDDLASKTTSFTLQLGNVGGFPNLKRARVLLVGLVGQMQRLTTLANLVEDACEPLGFKREDRPFTPHLTVARIRDSASHGERRKAGEALTSLPWRSSGTPVPIDSIHLIKSTLTPQGPNYETLHTVALPLSSQPPLP